MDSQTSQAPLGQPGATETKEPTEVTGAEPVGGPVSRAWREATLTRAKELEALFAWVLANNPQPNSDVLAKAIPRHIEAARDAAKATRSLNRLRVFRNALLFERAMTNLDAAEVHILNIARVDYLLGQLPSLLREVQCHLIPTDARRQELERIAKALGVKDPDHPRTRSGNPPVATTIQQERGKIVTAVRGARSVALREQVRLRSFRNVVVVTTVLMFLLALGVGFLGVRDPRLIPLCFAPEEAGRAVVVCPTQQSQSFSTARDAGAQAQPTTTTTGTQRTTQPTQPTQPQQIQQTEQATATTTDIDDYVAKTVSRWDLFLVEFVGMAAAAVAAAAAIRRLKGSSERHGLPVAMAVLKLPTGAITAFLGLLLMRGQFVPGLSALDTSAQILAWALVFGYAQQLFTRLVDQQGQTVLERPRRRPAPTHPRSALSPSRAARYQRPGAGPLGIEPVASSRSFGPFAQAIRYEPKDTGSPNWLPARRAVVARHPRRHPRHPRCRPGEVDAWGRHGTLARQPTTRRRSPPRRVRYQPDVQIGATVPDRSFP